MNFITNIYRTIIIKSHGASRFDSVNNPNSERIHNRAGFYKTDEQGFRVYLVLSEIFRKEICQGFEPKAVTRILIDKGWLVPGKDGKASQKPRNKGVGIPRCYVFTNRLWEDDYNNF
jgi:putative DNA primase/helicase